MNIGIVGYGDVGQVIEANFEESCIIGVYDDDYSGQDGHQFCSSIVNLAQGSDFVFVTLPVVANDQGECDFSKIDDAMREILVEASTEGLSPIVIISSIVSSSVISKYLAIYKNDRFVVCAEPIRKLDYLYDDQSNVKMSIGGSLVTARSVCQLYDRYSSITYGDKDVMTHLDACTLKERSNVNVS